LRFGGLFLGLGRNDHKAQNTEALIVTLISVDLLSQQREHRMDRNRLKGTTGDRINSILSAVGMNFAKLLKWAADFLRLITYWLFGRQRAIFIMPTN